MGLHDSMNHDLLDVEDIENKKKRDEVISRRRKFVRELKSMSETKDDFPPLAAPYLAESDIMFLVDVFTGDDEENHVSSAIAWRSSHTTPFEGDSIIFDLPVDNNRSVNGTVNLILHDDGIFSIDMPHVHCRTYAIRLTDLNIICLNNFFRRPTPLDNDIAHSPFLSQEEIERPDESLYLGVHEHEAMGTIPTMLTSRLRILGHEYSSYFAIFYSTLI